MRVAAIAHVVAAIVAPGVATGVALGVALVIALAVATGACSGKPRAEDAARGVAARGDQTAASDGGSASAAPADGAGGDAAVGDAAPGAAGARAATAARSGAGDLQVRVEWPEVPVAARVSPGRTHCNTPRAASVAPTTTWGIPEALVVVEGAAAPARGGLSAASAPARVTLADCALTPRIAVGDRLAITSAVDRPAKLVLRKRGALDQLAAGPAIPVMLPIAGHTVTVALDAGAIYSVETDDADPEFAFVAAVAGAFVTDATGHALIRDLAAGAHAVTAWLPPRGGQPARVGHGTATVAAGDLEELTLKLTK